VEILKIVCYNARGDWKPLSFLKANGCFFTRSAVTLAESNGVLLWDRTKLLAFIKNAGLKIE